MPDTWSFMLGGRIELLGSAIGVPSNLPGCEGVVFLLDQGWDFGAPQPVVTATASLSTDGERPVGRKASNRTLKLPVNIIAPDMDTRATAVEKLLQLIDEESFEGRWVRQAGAPAVLFDCFRAQPSEPVYSLEEQEACIAQINLTIPALPYARGEDLEVISFLNYMRNNGITHYAVGPPPVPVVIDGFSSIPSGNPGWSLTGAFPNTLHSNSAAYLLSGSTPVSAPTYTAPVGTHDLSAHKAFKVWIGLASTDQPFIRSRQVPVTFRITLTDGGGHHVHFGRSYNLHPGEFGKPVFKHLSFRFPTSGIGSFDYTNVQEYQIEIFNYADATMKNFSPYIAFIEAYPSSSVASLMIPATGTTLGNVYRVNGVLGSARTYLNLIVQQFSLTGITAGGAAFTETDTWIAPEGCDSVSVEIIADAGDGQPMPSSGTPAAGGQGGGGGEWGQDTALVVTPLSEYNISFTGTHVTFVGDSVTLSCANGADGVDGGAGGSGTPNATGTQTHHAGGNGAAGTLSGSTSIGGGGGASGSTAGAGANASGSTGGAATGDGGSGGDGALGTSGHEVGLPGVAPGGGGGGASIDPSVNEPGGLGAGGRVVLSYFNGSPSPFYNVLVHRPKWDASDDVPMYIPLKQSGPITEGVLLIASGATMASGTVVYSANNLYFASMNPLGNLVVYFPGLPYGFGSGASTAKLPQFRGQEGDYFTMQSDGQLVHRKEDSGATDWTTGVTEAGAQLYLMNDGNLCIFNAAGTKVLWAAYAQPGIPEWMEPIVPPMEPGFNARFNGTYSVVLVADSWDDPTVERTVSLMIRQCEFQRDFSESPTLSRTFTPSTDGINGDPYFISLGEMTIPDKALPPENVSAYYQYRLESDHPNDRWSDLMFLDTQGETVIINETDPGPEEYAQYFIDEPVADLDYGFISGSRADRLQAVSVFDKAWVSGGPISAEPGDNLLLVYSRNGPPALQAVYRGRYMVDASEDFI